MVSPVGCVSLRLAGPADIPRLVAGQDVHQGLPPPGTTMAAYFKNHPMPIGRIPWRAVCGEPSEGAAGDWWVASLSEVYIGVPDELAAVVARLAALFTGPIAAYAGTVASWPVIYEQGGGTIVRWLRATLRGELGNGVEQFQTKVDLGNPGNDPTLDEAGALALAAQLKAVLTTSFNATLGNNEKGTLLFTADVKFTEIGVVELTQDDPSNSDGSGGTQVPSYPTQWSLIAGGLAGTGTGNSLPYEVSCAVSLQTDTAGPSGRGRMFLPPFMSSRMAAGGLYNNSTVIGAGLFVGHFFAGITAGTPYEPVVVSHRQRQLREIKRIYVGQVPDSQRRRRRSQDEARLLAWTKA